MSNYRKLWVDGREGLVKLIEGLQLIQISELVPKRSGIDLVTRKTCDSEYVVGAVDRLFDVHDYGLRVRGRQGQSDFYIELANEDGEVRFNRFVFPPVKED